MRCIISEERFRGSDTEDHRQTLSEALHNLEKLRPAAEELAPAVRAEHSAKRVLESMLALAQKSLDVKPRYGFGEEIG